MSKCFGLVNEVDSHNKSHQLDLALDKFWVTKCGWLRLCTTVSMGVNNNNCWKLISIGLKGTTTKTLSALGDSQK